MVACRSTRDQQPIKGAMQKAILFNLVFLAGIAQAQQWQAVLPTIERSGLHAIILGPELIGASREDIGDLRLVDSTGQDVPYLLRMAGSGPVRSRFVPYELVRNEVLPKSTVVEIERPQDQQIDELHIWVRPVEVRKQVRITGSDNGTKWYMVKDDHVVPQGARGEPPHQVLLLEVPRSDYRYLRITLNDSLTAPMQILGVGRFVEQALPARYTEATINWQQRDSAGTTTLYVSAERPVLVERISYAVRDTLPFHRSGQMRATHSTEIRDRRKRRTVEQEMTLAYFTLASDLDHVITLPGSQEKEFDLRIDNRDDRPLRFSDLKVYQVERTILANLEPGMRYHFTTGDPERHAPKFDMAHFQKELLAPVATIDHASLQAMPKDKKAGPAFDPAKWWIWVIILALMVGMGLMAVKMLGKEGDVASH